MKNPLIKIVSLALPCFFFLPLHSQEEQLIYSERFTNLTGDGVNLSGYGWTGLMFDPMHADPNEPVDVTTRDGQPHATSTAIGLGGFELCFCEDDEGLLYMWGGNKQTEYALLTDQAAIDRSQMELSRVVCYSNSNQPNPNYEMRVIIQIDGSIYASANAVSRSGDAAMEWERHEFTFNSEDSQWLELQAGVGINWNLATEPVSGPLPSGNIEAMGFYVLRGQGGDGSIRLDEVEIYAIESTTGGGSEWNGFTVEDGYVDTGIGGWLNGFVFVGEAENAGWVYIFSLGKYVYVTPAGWVYLNR